ncbi:MAG TPA: lytic murein transglycosylase [Thermoleophilaceae bacterium]|nr:lytic murein transglycosylase [Thermoleophilaceae bacterium]
MKRRALTLLLAAGLLVTAALTAVTFPASAQTQTVYVELATGEVVPVTVDVPPDTSIDDIQLPGTTVPAPTTPTTPTAPTAPTAPKPAPTPAPAPDGTTDGTTDGTQAPTSDGGSAQERSSSGERVQQRTGTGRDLTGRAKSRVEDDLSRARRRGRRDPLRNPDGTPTRDNPGFTDVLPGPSTTTGVPNFIIRKFRVPPFLLPIYQAAGVEYGIRWEILAAINEIETDYGRNLNVSSAGALGWMQFMPATWQMYGTDANKDGRKDPYNPVDAIFAAARYLKAANYENDVRAAIWAYNHADWYVDSVLLRARLIAGVPADLIGSLTGLTEGRFPVYARARYADDVAEKELIKRVKQGENAANVIESSDDRRSIDIFAKKGAPIVAVNDGVIKEIGRSKKLGRYMMLQDVYGNRYTYAHLGEVSKFYPVPKNDGADDPKRTARAVHANEDPKPDAPASAGRQADSSDTQKERDRGGDVPNDTAKASAPVKDRLFAHPDMPGSRTAGGLEQLLDAEARRSGNFETYKNFFSRPFGLDPDKVKLRPLKKGSRVIGGTIIARVGQTVEGKASHVNFAIRPAGRGAPKVDPKPILDGWKLLEATAIYRASGRNVLHGKDEGGAMSIGQIMLLPKPMLEKRVLADERIDIYGCGQDDIRSGQIDRRILVTLAYLAESGLEPGVTSLKCGHGFYTSSGNVSHHSSGNAVDIATINGIPVLGHQEPGGVTEQAVRRLMQLQGTMAPAQIISLFEIGGATFAMGDHHDHIHVGFQPMFGENRKLGKQALAVLEPGQWSNLIDRLGEIENPVVPTKPSKYALPAKKRSSKAHHGE